MMVMMIKQRDCKAAAAADDDDGIDDDDDDDNDNDKDKKVTRGPIAFQIIILLQLRMSNIPEEQVNAMPSGALASCVSRSPTKIILILYYKRHRVFLKGRFSTISMLRYRTK